MEGRPYEFWIALLTGMLIVFERHRDKPVFARAVIAAISGGIGFSMAPDLSEWLNRSETLAAMILTALGYLVIDVAASIIADRDFLKDFIKSRLGGGKG
ncbi:hypothetical protein [Oceanicola sp. S124]|uniref:hypothetical protein n=1 Tax=Oceanicola sp. S124 TaxID=1042378 RepID=UPI000255A969|nr:hypothetical protein [Oceanicola sp. S124]